MNTKKKLNKAQHKKRILILYLKSLVVVIVLLTNVQVVNLTNPANKQWIFFAQELFFPPLNNILKKV